MTDKEFDVCGKLKESDILDYSINKAGNPVQVFKLLAFYALFEILNTGRDNIFYLFKWNFG
jgi:hypothetical protein